MVARRTEPSAEDVAVWLPGALTVRQARREFNLSAHELRALMADGTLRYRIRDLKGTRLIARIDLARYVASLPTS